MAQSKSLAQSMWNTKSADADAGSKPPGVFAVLSCSVRVYTEKSPMGSTARFIWLKVPGRGVAVTTWMPVMRSPPLIWKSPAVRDSAGSAGTGAMSAGEPGRFRMK